MTAFEIIFSAIFAPLITFAISNLIDSLYKKSHEELSFPEKLGKNIFFRKIFLSAGIFFCTIFLIKLPAPINFYYTIAAIFLLTIIVTDIEQQIIFDKILLPFAILGIIFSINLNLPLRDHLIAAISGGGFFLLTGLIIKNGVGGGDIKFVASLGLWFGTEKLFSIVTTGIFFSAAVVIILILLGKVKREDRFAYAPYIAIPAIYALIY